MFADEIPITDQSPLVEGFRKLEDPERKMFNEELNRYQSENDVLNAETRFLTIFSIILLLSTIGGIFVW